MYLFQLWPKTTTTTKHSLLLRLKNKYAQVQAVIVCVLKYSWFYYRARCHGLCGFYETFTGLKGHFNGCQHLRIIEDTCEHKSRRESSTIIITGFTVSVCVYIFLLEICHDFYNIHLHLIFVSFLRVLITIIRMWSSTKCKHNRILNTSLLSISHRTDQKKLA